MEKSARGHPNSSAIGIWNIPKLARMAKDSIRMQQPPIRTGVIRGAFVMQASLGLAGAKVPTLLLPGRAVKTGPGMRARAAGDRKADLGGLSLPGLAG
jgi:hypothetical protein